MGIKSANIQYLDTLRALAAIGVITLHVSTPVLKMMYGVNMEYWWIGNSIDSSVRFVIALFLMLSGATMLHREYRLGEFYRKRFIRVLVPFLFWLVAYWIYRWAILTPKMQPHSFQSIVNWGVNLFITEGVSKHFWYIYMILVLYLFLPFLGKALRKINNRQIGAVLMMWVILNILFSNIINTADWNYFLQKAKDYFLYSGYFIVGYFLMNIPFEPRKYRKLNLTIFLMTVVFSAFTTYFASKSAHKLDTQFYGTLTVNTMLQSVSLFMLLKDSEMKNRIFAWIINLISNYSYGIYLVHIMIISILFNHGIFWTMAYPLISLPVIILLTLLISLSVIFVLRKIPLGKYISG